MPLLDDQERLKQLVRIEYERGAASADLAKRSLKHFVRDAWPVLEPSTPFIDGWHLDAICDHLMAVSSGDIKRLLVNMPPRHCKSTLISVIWSVWLLLNTPSTRILCASYALNLATRDNIKARRLIKSPWFQTRYGHIFSLQADQDAKMKFETNQLGYRMVTSVGAGTTGEGGDILLCLCYDTEVTTDKGRLCIGDIVEYRLPVRVLTYDHVTHAARWQAIEKYEKNPGKSCVRVTFSDGRIVDATVDHPFYVVDRGYVQADQLIKSDEVVTEGTRQRQMPALSAHSRGKRERTWKSGYSLPLVPWEDARQRGPAAGTQTLLVRRIEQLATPEYVYNLRITEDHNYFANGVLVHNCDDPHAIEEKESQQKREVALDWFDNTWCTRLNDPQKSTMVVIGHRIHEQDVSGHILDTANGEWTHLNLPAEYESAIACKTFYPSGKALWADPRKEEGELLWPERFPQKTIENAKRRHGPLGYAALYGQRPTSAKGGTFKVQNERLFTQSADAYYLHTPQGIKAVKKEECVVFLAVDPAISEKQSADYMVIMTCAKTPIKDTLVIDIKRGRWDHNLQQDEIVDAYKEHNAEYVAVETIAYQHALFQDLVAKGLPCRPFKPHSDKVARASTASIWQGNGKIYFLKDASWLPEFQKELYKFPKTTHDDMVDSLALASIVTRSRGPLSEASDDEDIPESVEVIEPVSIKVIRIDAFAWADEHIGGAW